MSSETIYDNQQRQKEIIGRFLLEQSTLEDFADLLTFFCFKFDGYAEDIQPALAYLIGQLYCISFLEDHFSFEIPDSLVSYHI